MIKLYDKIWYVRRGEEELAYLCQYEENTGFEKRKATGLSWANGYRNPNKTAVGVTEVNSPLKGFAILDSVSRWSTQNKLIRIRDPRGFVCEITTGNLVNLLKTATITKCEVQEECVWGRDGANNILLPVNSEPYLEAIQNTERGKKPKVSIKTIAPGALVKFMQYGELSDEYIYLGQGNISYNISFTKNEYLGYNGFYDRYNHNAKVKQTLLSKEVIKDPKSTHIFLPLSTYISNKSELNFYSLKILSSPNVFEVVDPTRYNANDVRREYFIKVWGLPNRVTELVNSHHTDGYIGRGYNRYNIESNFHINTKDIEWKN